MKAPQIAPIEGVAIGGAFAVCVGFVLSPGEIEDGRVLCPFRLATGSPCPTCGITRSWVYALHGWWREALITNPFGFATLGALSVLAVALMILRLKGVRPPTLDLILRNRWVVGFFALWGSYGVIRLLSAR